MCAPPLPAPPAGCLLLALLLAGCLLAPCFCLFPPAGCFLLAACLLAAVFLATYLWWQLESRP